MHGEADRARGGRTRANATSTMNLQPLLRHHEGEEEGWRRMTERIEGNFGGCRMDTTNQGALQDEGEKYYVINVRKIFGFLHVMVLILTLGFLNVVVHVSKSIELLLYGDRMIVFNCK